MEDTGFDFLKIGLVLVALPLWGPFAKALYEELQSALRPEGGLFGSHLSPRQRKKVEAEIEMEELPQVHEHLAHYRQKLGLQPGASGGAGRSGPASRPGQGGPQATGQRSAFRNQNARPSRPSFR